jgi:hypothetical protein
MIIQLVIVVLMSLGDAGRRILLRGQQGGGLGFLLLGHSGERSQIAPDNSVDEHVSLLPGVPIRYIHHIRFKHQRPGLPINLVLVQ